MALLEKVDLISAFERLGELAVADGEQIDLLLLGRSVMVLAFDARPSTAMSMPSFWRPKNGPEFGESWK